MALAHPWQLPKKEAVTQTFATNVGDRACGPCCAIRPATRKCTPPDLTRTYRKDEKPTHRDPQGLQYNRRRDAKGRPVCGMERLILCAYTSHSRNAARDANPVTVADGGEPARKYGGYCRRQERKEATHGKIKPTGCLKPSCTLLFRFG